MEPATWIYLALLAASTAASYAGQKKTQRAQNAVLADERQRRGKLQDASYAAAQDSADKMAQTKAKQAARTEELAQMYKADAPVAQTDETGTRFLDVAAPTHSTATIEATKSELDKGKAFTDAIGAARGALGSFGDVMTQNMIDTGRNAQDIGRNAGEIQGWQQNVMPARMFHAGTAGQGWKTTGDILKLASMVYAPYALGNGGAAAGAGPESTSGVLGRMGGTPYEFAGRDLFGAAKMFPNATGFAGAAKAGLGAGGFGAGIVADPSQEKALLEYLNDPYWYLRPHPYDPVMH